MLLLDEVGLPLQENILHEVEQVLHVSKLLVAQLRPEPVRMVFNIRGTTLFLQEITAKEL